MIQPARPRQGELDELTLARARRGERAALAAVVEHHGRQVYALVGRMMAGRPHLVDDLSQETLVKVIQGLPRFDPAGPAKLSTWILTIATRTCLDALRRRRLEPIAEELALDRGASAGHGPGELATGDNPERLTAQRRLAQRAQDAVAALPPDQRAVLVLRAYHDLDYPEIAAALGIEEGTVKSRLGRARIALKQQLGLPAGSTVDP